MTHLLALVLVVGLVDSLNPTTIAPALYLAAGREAHRSLLGFIVGVFAVNLAAGVLLTIGPGDALLSRVPHPGVEVKHLLELIGGGVTLALAAGLWLGRRSIAKHVLGKEDRLDRSSLVIGAAITATELPTAVPYFAVIAAVVGSGRSTPTQITLLTLFNLAFVAPLLAVLVVRAVTNEGGRAWLERLRAHLEARLAVLVPVLVLLVSITLIAIGTVGVLTD